MGAPNLTRRALRFGDFAVDPRTPELQKNGARTKLQEQPFEILCMLLDRPGEVVTRQEMRLRLWPADTFVDFDVALNTAIKKLRDALSDSAEAPRYIETIPRRGYRFICPVSEMEGGASAASTVSATSAWLRRWAVSSLIVAALAIGAGLLTANVGGWRDRLLHRPAAHEITSIAVLPLRNLTGAPQQDYLAAGMTEMLITELGRPGSPRILSHQSVLQYAQTSKSLPEIARELDVDAVIEGRVLRIQNGFRITINFLQANPERHILAETYDRRWEDASLLLDDVTRDVLKKIRTNLPERLAVSSPAHQPSPEAMDVYLRGVHLLAMGRESDRDEARDYLQKAIEIDPAYARPYAALALMYAHGGFIRAGLGGAQGRKLTQEWAENALQLDGSLAEAHAALGWLSIGDWDFQKAEREFQRAIELNPSLARARVWYAQFLGALGRYPEAFAQTAVALQLARGSPEDVSHAVEPYLQGGRVDDAIAQWRAMVDLKPDYWAAHYYLALGYMKKGLYQNAVSEAEESARLSQRDFANLSLLGSVYAKAGQRAKALNILHEFQTSGGSGERPAGLALIYAALGENDKALVLLEEACKARKPALAFVNTRPQFDGLRSGPRFRKLLQRIGLPAS